MLYKFFMQDPSRCSDHFSCVDNNSSQHNDNISDSNSWNSELEDDQQSNKSGLYKDVHTTSSQPDVSIQTGRVAALAKIVAASLSAGQSGSSARAKQNSHVQNVRQPVTSRALERIPNNKLLSRSGDKPPVPSRPAVLVAKPLSPRPSPPLIKKPSNDIRSSTNSCNSSSSSGISSASSSSSLPKPPGPSSEHVRQVIGALGQLWPSDSTSLSSQTQSDDDYEPIHDNSASKSRLNVHSKYPASPPVEECESDREFKNQDDEGIPNTHSSQAQLSFVHRYGSAKNLLEEDLLQFKSSSSTSQRTPFLHSAAAFAAVHSASQSSGDESRLSQCSQSSGSEQYFPSSVVSSPSSGSNQSEISHKTVFGAVCQDSVYEPIEEKDKISTGSGSETLERACDVKRAATVPNVGARNQPPEHRAPVSNRPLPPTPQPGVLAKGGLLAANLEHQPWFHNVDRKRAEELVRNGKNGHFLIRPSSQSQNPLTLTLWYNQRVYNISVRHRKDGRISLGFEKPDEQSFASVEEMVINYKSENLLLFSRNERTGRTVLTTHPQKHHH